MPVEESKPRVIVAQLGAARHYAVPRIFHEAGMLERLYTDSYVGDKPWLERSLKAIPERLRPRALTRLLGRKDEHVPPEKVMSFDLFGLRYTEARRKAGDTAALTYVFADWGRRFCEKVIASQPPEVDLVWGYDGAALELFRWAKARGMRCVLEQTIAPWQIVRRLLAEELERWPSWQPNLQLPPEPDPIAERHEAEWQLADRIIAGSQFVVDGVLACDGPGEKCVVVPYGVDPAPYCPPRTRERSRGKLRVLFVGEVGLRKGAPYLLEALRQLGPENVEAKFAGQTSLARERLAAYEDVATFLGAVPRPQTPELYQWADVFVLPSICEGSAAVIYEALAAGLYVITTPNAGSVLDGASPFGEVVPIRNSAAIVDSLRRRLSSKGATRIPRDWAAVPAITLEDYRHRLLKAVA